MFDNINDLRELYRLFFRMTDEEIIISFQNEGFLKPLGRCPKSTCRRREVLGRNNNYKGNYAAYCRSCKKFRSLTEGSFFDRNHLSFEENFVLLWLWTAHVSSGDAAKIVNIPRQSVVQFYRFFRDVCSWKLLNMPPKKIGGPGHIVQIDESVISKRKHNVGRMPKLQWIFGMVDMETREGVCMYVQKRDKATLLPLIQKHIEVGTTIWSDGWKVYQQLPSLGYFHGVVNHSKEFVSAEGVCTNIVENYWLRLKRFLRHANAMFSTLLPEHVDEFMWRDVFKGSVNYQFVSMIKHIRERYPL